MKSERISIFNYEAFYLDHLEGNLGEEDTVLLLDFLAEHPDLIVEEDDFVILDPKDETAIFSDKESLKIVSDDAVISLANVEHFLVAESEGQLSASKQSELDALVSQYPYLENERAYLAQTLLKADETLIFSDKDSLKIMSDEAAIVLSNVQHFLVAESEGQLPASKLVELNAFVSQHPHLEEDRAYLAAVFLKADTSIVYANKAGLKRKGAIIFWPYIALAAASLLIAFLFTMNTDPQEPGIAKKDAPKKEEILKQETPIQESNDVQLANDVAPSNSIDDQKTTNSVPNQSSNQAVNIARENTRQRQQVASVNTLKSKKPRRVINSIDELNLQPVASFINPQEVKMMPENDLAQASSPEMKNPIKPITSRLGKTLKTNVDFQTGKAANNTGAGFYLKIGKFELSRKNGKK